MDRPDPASGLIIVFAALDSSSFVTRRNARNILTDAAVLLVLAVGMTYVIITAGIDLSVGAVLVFSGVVAAKLMGARRRRQLGRDPARARRRARRGPVLGHRQRLLVAKAKIPPLIVTLGTLGMALGFALPDHGRRRRARGADQAHRHDRHRRLFGRSPIW